MDYLRYTTLAAINNIHVAMKRADASFNSVRFARAPDDTIRGFEVVYSYASTAKAKRIERLKELVEPRDPGSIMTVYGALMECHAKGEFYFNGCCITEEDVMFMARHAGLDGVSHVVRDEQGIQVVFTHDRPEDEFAQHIRKLATETLTKEPYLSAFADLCADMAENHEACVSA